MKRKNKRKIEKSNNKGHVLWGNNNNNNNNKRKQKNEKDFFQKKMKKIGGKNVSKKGGHF
jgi:hypothetical protein